MHQGRIDALVEIATIHLDCIDTDHTFRQLPAGVVDKQDSRRNVHTIVLCKCRHVPLPAREITQPRTAIERQFADNDLVGVLAAKQHRLDELCLELVAVTAGDRTEHQHDG